MLSVSDIGWLFKGLLNNLLVTFLAGSLAIAIGVGLTFAVWMVKNKSATFFLKIVGVVPYCLAPVGLMMAIYYNRDILFSPIWILIIALTISHSGYFLMHYNQDSSLKKNLFVNSLGLFSSVFMWSTVSSFVGFADVFRWANRLTARYYESSSYLLCLGLCFLVLAAFNVPRIILKEKME